MRDGTVVGEELLESSGEPEAGKEGAYPYPTPQDAARAKRIIALVGQRPTPVAVLVADNGGLLGRLLVSRHVRVHRPVADGSDGPRMGVPGGATVAPLRSIRRDIGQADSPGPRYM